MTSLLNPWPSFSPNVGFLDQDKDDHWRSVWEVNNQSIDPIMVAADFYLLSAISAGFLRDATPPFIDFSLAEIKASAVFLGLSSSVIKKRVEVGRIKAEESFNPLYEIEQQAIQMIDLLVDAHIDSFINYLEMVTGGELRHHPGLRQATLPSNRRVAWYAWKEIRDTFGNEALEMAIEYFLDFDGGGYGGEPWATAPRLLLQYFTSVLGPDVASNRRMFMDRVFTLVHNNGCMLNKLEWDNRRDYTETSEGEICAYYELESGMGLVLDAHANNPPVLEDLIAFSSDDVGALANRYLAVCAE